LGLGLIRSLSRASKLWREEAKAQKTGGSAREEEKELNLLTNERPT